MRMQIGSHVHIDWHWRTLQSLVVIHRRWRHRCCCCECTTFTPRIFPPLDICPFPVPDPNPYCKPYPSLKPDNPNLNTSIVVNNPLNKSVSSFLRQRTTWHCPHSPAICTGERESKLLARSYRLTLTSRKTLLPGRYMPPPTPLSLLLLRM